MSRPRIMRTLKKYLHWTIVAPETWNRFSLFFPVGARGSICIDLQGPEGVLRGRIEFAILFRFEPPRISWIPSAVWQNDLYAFHSASSEWHVGYTRPRIFYLWFHDTPDDENQENTVGRPRDG